MFRTYDLSAILLGEPFPSDRPILVSHPYIFTSDRLILMWTCPKCGHKFYNTNQSHSCGSYTVDDLLAGKTRKAIDLYEQFLAAYRRIGPFEVHPVRTRIALLTRMRFCAINKFAADHIDVHLVLTEPFPDSTCFFKIDNFSDRFFVHHLRIRHPSDITAEVKGFMKRAYAVGNREHVRKKGSEA
jgi:hypothetical protein